MRTIRTITFLACIAGCGGGRDASSLREAVDQSRVRISDMVSVAEGSMPSGRAITAKLRIDGDTPIYAYGTLGTGTMHDVRIETIAGSIVSSLETGRGSDSCPDSISLTEAIGIAEAAVVGGTVIAAIPDDDVACAREIQVLDPSRLMEVKVGGDGAVLELEESDETED